MWRRTIPNPTLATFDQPERNMCTIKRQKTNTPLQALTLLNDPTFVEASKVLGEKMTQLYDHQESIKFGFTKLTGRPPTSKELQLLSMVQQKEYEISKLKPSMSKGWLSTGAYSIDPLLDQHLIYANAIVVSTIMNSDAFITKR